MTTEDKKLGISYITDEMTQEFISKGIAVVLLYMPDSSSSSFQEELLRGVYDDYEDKISIGFLNVLENQEFPIYYGIRSFPTTLYFKDGDLLLSETGVQKDIENSLLNIL